MIRMLLLFSALCMAEESAEYEIVVTGERDLEAVSTATVSVIRKEEFAGRNTTLSEVIDQESGIRVRKMGGLGEYSTVSIRGSASEQVKVYLDGVEINSGSGGGVDLGKIPLSDVERVEIYKGTIPAEFQGNGIGGVVNIVTARTGQGLVSGQATLGSFGTEKAGVMASGSLGKWGLMAGGDYQNSANDYEWLDNRGTTLGRNPSADDTIRKMENNDFTSYAGSVKADYQDEGPYALGFDLSGRTSDKGWFYTLAAPPFRTRVESGEYAFSGNAKYRAALLTLEGRAGYRASSRRFSDPDGTIFYVSQDVTDLTRKGEGAASIRYHPVKACVTALIVQGSLETFYERNNLQTASSERPDVRRYSALFTLSEDADLFRGRTSITAAATLDYRDTRSSFSEKRVLWRRLPDGTVENTYPNLNAGVKFAFNDDHSVKINSGYYTRVPDFYELFGNNAFSIGNDSLLPEKGVNNDLTFQDRFRLPGGLVLRSSLSVFANLLRDQIVFVYYGSHFVKPKNVSDVRIGGVEHDAELARGRISIRNQFAYMKSEIMNSGKESPYLPAVKNTLSVLTGMPWNGEVRYDLNFRSEYFKSEYNNVVLPETWSHDIALRWGGPGNLFGITGEIKNVTDSKNRDMEAFPLPGRAYYLTIMSQLKFKARETK